MTYDNLQATDTMIVNRGENSYQVSLDAIQTDSDVLRDDDVFLVNRGANSYKVTKAVLKDEIGGGGSPVIGDVVLTQDQTNANRFTSNSFTTTVAGTNIQQLSMEATVTGALAIEGTTDAIKTNDHSGGANIPLELNSDFNLDNNMFEVGDVIVTNETYRPTTSKLVSATSTISVKYEDYLTTNSPPVQSRDGGAFNGSRGGYHESQGNPGNGESSLTFTPPFPMEYSSCTVYGRPSWDSIVRISLNNGSWQTFGSSQANSNEPCVIDQGAGTLTTFTMLRKHYTDPTGSRLRTYLHAVSLDGETYLTSSEFSGIEVVLVFEDSTDFKYIQEGDQIRNTNSGTVYNVTLVDEGTSTITVRLLEFFTEEEWLTGETITLANDKKGEGTISSITGAAVTIEPFVDNAFIPGQYLVHKTPKVISIIPKSDSIDSYDASTKTITLTGDKDLFEFANGDAVTMCDVDGNPVSYAASLTVDTVSSFGGSTLLTFTDPSDLKYWKEGDVLKGNVPSGNPAWNEDKVWSDYYERGGGGNWDSGSPVQAHDGNTTTDLLNETSITFRPPDLSFSDKIEIWTATNNNVDDSKVYRVQTTNGEYQTTAGEANSPHGGYWKGYVNITGGMSSGSKGPILQIYAGQSDIWNSWYAIRVDGKLLVNPSGNLTVVSIDTDANQMVVSSDLVTAGETFTKDLSGTGTVDLSDASSNTITLSASNDEWVDGYYVKGPTKPAVSMTAYLNFDPFGNVNGLQSFPYNSLLLETATPKLTFPATFSTGTAPDTDIPYPSYLQTTVQGLGAANTDKIDSNTLFPATNTVLALKTPKTYTTEQFGDFCRWVQTYEYRAATAKVEEGEKLKSEFDQKVQKLKETAANFLQEKDPSGEGV